MSGEPRDSIPPGSDEMYAAFGRAVAMEPETAQAAGYDIHGAMVRLANQEAAEREGDQAELSRQQILDRIDYSMDTQRLDHQDKITFRAAAKVLRDDAPMVEACTLMDAALETTVTRTSLTTHRARYTPVGGAATRAEGATSDEAIIAAHRKLVEEQETP